MLSNIVMNSESFIVISNPKIFSFLVRNLNHLSSKYPILAWLALSMRKFSQQLSAVRQAMWPQKFLNKIHTARNVTTGVSELSFIFCFVGLHPFMMKITFYFLRKLRRESLTSMDPYGVLYQKVQKISFVNFWSLIRKIESLLKSF